MGILWAYAGAIVPLEAGGCFKHVDLCRNSANGTKRSDNKQVETALTHSPLRAYI